MKKFAFMFSFLAAISTNANAWFFIFPIPSGRASPSVESAPQQETPTQPAKQALKLADGWQVTEKNSWFELGFDPTPQNQQIANTMPSPDRFLSPNSSDKKFVSSFRKNCTDEKLKGVYKDKESNVIIYWLECSTEAQFFKCPADSGCGMNKMGYLTNRRSGETSMPSIVSPEADGTPAQKEKTFGSLSNPGNIKTSGRESSTNAPSSDPQGNNPSQEAEPTDIELKLKKLKKLLDGKLIDKNDYDKKKNELLKSF